MFHDNWLLLDVNKKPIHWQALSPDKLSLSDKLTELDGTVFGIAIYQHGSGNPWPSEDDILCFSDIESSVNKRFEWWIVNSSSVIVVTKCGTSEHEYQIAIPEVCGIEESIYRDWVGKLRSLSCRSHEHDGT
jgi:hypothetical protein